MAGIPSRGRAARIEQAVAPGCRATKDLYERFSGQIYGYCLHQLGSREEAEDALQTTFMNAFRGLQRGIVPKVESAWLFKIAHNVCLSRRRSTWRRRKVEAPNNLEVLQEVVPAGERIGDELIRLEDVLTRMPDSQRRAILLREWQGLSYREIADELALSQSAVETLIFRARRALAAGLEVEPERRAWRKRARHGIDAGGLLAALKGLATGGTAVKVAATIAVATTAAVAVTGPHHHVAHHTRVHVAPVSRTRTARKVVSLPRFAALVRPHHVVATQSSKSRERSNAHARHTMPAPPRVSSTQRSASSTPAAARPMENHVAVKPPSNDAVDGKSKTDSTAPAGTSGPNGRENNNATPAGDANANTSPKPTPKAGQHDRPAPPTSGSNRKPSDGTRNGNGKGKSGGKRAR